jgi:hypothetical protein
VSHAIIRKKRDEGEQEILLHLLDRVAKDCGVSQAGFAQQVGIAKGLANAYFNRCLKKGLIRLRQVPRKRYLYYLTPKGFSEKARLTAEFLSSSYGYYRASRADLVATMAHAATEGHSRIGVLGTGELAEIAAIVGGDAAVEIIGFWATNGSRARVAGLPVVREWLVLKADAALLASIEDAQDVHDAFRKAEPKVPVYVPTQLQALLKE